MRIFIIILLFLLTVSCGYQSKNYWCGDHPCINKNEKEAYFKNNMIIEVKEDKNFKSKKSSEIEKIMNQARKNEEKRILNEKKLAKKNKLEEKERLKEEKRLLKQAKIDEKKKAKEEKRLKKNSIKEDKKIIKEKEVAKKIKKNTSEDTTKIQKKSKSKVERKTSTAKTHVNLSSFKKLADEITKRNNLRPFPDINDIPN
tara:strand:- start:845 stop:1444 length:600 start_codon:yes stop_codon:yes gene_type:complete